MKEQLISFETAKLAKEKGFDIPIRQQNGVFVLSTGKIDNIISTDKISNWNDDKYVDICSAPTQSLLQRWLRERYDIYVTALPFRDVEDEVELCWYFSLVEDSEELDDILCNESHLGASDDNYKTYEEALEKGLQEALKLIE